MVALDAVVLPAFRIEDQQDEVDPWLDRHDLDETVPVAPGGDDFHTPLFHDGSLGVVATGIGPSAAALTVSALVASDAVDCSDATFVTAGVAGAPPQRATLGTTFVHDAIVDWDSKHRVHQDELGPGEVGIEMHNYRPRDYVYRPPAPLVERALDVASSVDLADWDLGEEVRDRYAEADPPAEPTLERGTDVSGAEFWHGAGMAAEVEWLVDQYEAGTYCTTESECAGTAHALYRHDALDRYVSIRSVSNFDRPPADVDPGESLAGWDEGLPLAVENVYRVASAVVADVQENPGAWRVDG